MKKVLLFLAGIGLAIYLVIKKETKKYTVLYKMWKRNKSRK